MTSVVISQPMYFPWAGFLAHMALADVFIFLDDAQFSKGSYTNRIQVKLPGGTTWMSVPLVGKGAFQTIRDLHPAGDGWRASHRALLAQSLRGRDQTAAAMTLFDAVMAGPHVPLCDRLIASCETLARAMGVLPPVILRASAMGVGGVSWGRVLHLVQAVGGTRYVTGHGASDYLDHNAFEAAGIDVHYMDYAPLSWRQPHGAFTPYLTGLDLLASCTPEAARDHLRPASIDWRMWRARKHFPT